MEGEISGWSCWKIIVIHADGIIVQEKATNCGVGKIADVIAMKKSGVEKGISLFLNIWSVRSQYTSKGKTNDKRDAKGVLGRYRYKSSSFAAAAAAAAAVFTYHAYAC
ncbi:transcript antisense to ribosomal RNA protein [Echinococcus multilocularis]|uniref:Transcript antisense to ribosomal RNA protein n=1 Tax=Echinococcus multilocularis TaxID=6211 RepID=A0A0S4MJ64_ECHMU|nr:transcript antisense to ribosomal RNA protein [Echinococcus multilocularis]CUT98464.1 transcript antisense to ribosomal RNA protein [Echinococcus multilocularis]CUT98505.1 transcript antisense to ribosomal RNA protein [Echinococcus multilocularis]CUT98506.1 transcript antisense to ribosomal RNA protein [Echinococcus multilocularis]